jgi:hypothetical protein
VAVPVPGPADSIFLAILSSLYLQNYDIYYFPANFIPAFSINFVIFIQAEILKIGPGGN